MLYVPVELLDEIDRIHDKFGLENAEAIRKIVRNSQLLAEFDIDIQDILESKFKRAKFI